MSQKGQFSSSEEVAAEILRQLEEDVDSDTLQKKLWTALIPDSQINNVTQRDGESSGESEDDYCINENSDKEATILTMSENHNGTGWSKGSSDSLQRCRSIENIVRVQGGSTKFILNRADTSSDVFEELLGKNPPLNIQKSTVAFELSIDELKAFLGLCVICGVIKG